MKPSEVKNYYRNGYQFAKKTGISRQSFENWQRWGYIPIHSQFKIQELTEGKLVACWHDVPKDVN